MAPIASCETIGNGESLSSSSGSKTEEESKTPTKQDGTISSSRSANDIIENVLSNAIKVNVTDGILKRDTQNNVKFSLMSIQENNSNNFKTSEDTDLNGNNSDEEESESESSNFHDLIFI